MTETPIAVLGAGSWGTALANLLACKHGAARIWAFEPDVVDGINTGHENPTFLANSPLPAGLCASTDATAVVRGARVIVSAAPSHAVRSVLERVRSAVEPGAIIVSATKGIEPESLDLMSEVVAEVLPAARFAVLSGPSFAQEVYQGQPTAVVAASRDPEAAAETQRIFATSRFRVYTHHDVVGVEIGGALKNVIAIAAGILEGLGLGHNPRAALVTRGLAEITRLGVAMGADPLTFAGLAGMGDLILTTTGELSRNRSLGLAVARGQSLEEYRATHRSIAEGANASKAGAALAARVGVELPITRQVCDILFDGKSAAEAVGELMERELKAEQWR